MPELKIPAILEHIDYSLLHRIDLALEGNWNATVKVIWTKEKGMIPYDFEDLQHEWMKPSIELYFEREWIGIHCYRRIDNQNVYDAEYAGKIINYINKNIALCETQ
jgi:hypothetical protein